MKDGTDLMAHIKQEVLETWILPANWLIWSFYLKSYRCSLRLEVAIVDALQARSTIKTLVVEQS